jgi:hypothetical protein
MRAVQTVDRGAVPTRIRGVRFDIPAWARRGAVKLAQTA